MNDVTQELKWSLPTIRKMVRKNAGLSNIFKVIRKQERTSYIGDIPIFIQILDTFAEMGISKNRAELTYALRKIDEYRDMTKREKMEYLDMFLNIFYATEKDKISAKSEEKGGSRH